MVEERAMERWFALEMTRFHRAIVPRPRPLFELVLEEQPTAPTKGGELHRYDPATLRRIHDAMSPLARRHLRLPVTFYVDRETSADVYVTDPAAIQMLEALGEAPGASVRDGKLWMGHARAQLVAQRHPGAFQFVHH